MDAKTTTLRRIATRTLGVLALAMLLAPASGVAHGRSPEQSCVPRPVYSCPSPPPTSQQRTLVWRARQTLAGGRNGESVWNATWSADGYVDNWWLQKTPVESAWFKNGFVDDVRFTDGMYPTDGPLYSVSIQGQGVQPKSVTVDTSQNYTFSGGSLNAKDGLVKRGSGSLQLNITQPLEAGRTALHDGTLVLGNDGALGLELAIHGGSVQATENRTLRSRVFFASTSASFYGPGTFTFPDARLNAGATTINVLAPRLTFNKGIYQGNASALIKDGSGELVLSGSSSYSGGTTVKRSTLLVNGDPNGAASQTGTGAVSVESGAKLAGRGNIAGDVKMNASATLAPSDVLAMNSLALAPNAVYQVSLNAGGAAPQNTYAVVRSGAQVDGSRLDIRLNYEPSVGDQFFILEGDATGEFVGQDGKPLLPTKPIFVTSPSGRRVTMRIEYVGAVVLTVVPENRPPQLSWPGQADPNAQILELAVDAGDTLQVIASASDPDELNFFRSPEVSYMGDDPGDPKPALSPPQYLPDLSVRKTFTWTPSKAQAPKTYTFKFKATDPEGLFDEKTLKVTVNLPNTAPRLILERPEGRILLEPAELKLEVDEGSKLRIKVTGFDDDQPPDGLNFSLEGQPASMGLVADPAGDPRVRIIEWMPGEEDGGKDFTVKVKVTDRPVGDPKLKAAEQTFTVKVNEVNSLPYYLMRQTEIKDIAGQAVKFQVEAIDLDVDKDGKRDSLFYAFKAGDPPPRSLLIPTQNQQGEYRIGGFFLMADAQGLNFKTPPGTYTFQIAVTDRTNPDGSLDLNVRPEQIQDVTLILEDPLGRGGAGANQPPELAQVLAQPIQPINEGQLFSFVASASDADGDVLTFDLSNEPIGANIDPATGQFTWTPNEEQGLGSFTFDVVVTDDEGLTDSETITLIVNEVDETVLSATPTPIPTPIPTVAPAATPEPTITNEPIAPTLTPEPIVTSEPVVPEPTPEAPPVIESIPTTEAIVAVPTPEPVAPTSTP